MSIGIIEWSPGMLVSFPPVIYRKIIPQIHQSTRTVTLMIPASLSTAILLPDCAIRPRREALPFSEVAIVENTSF